MGKAGVTEKEMMLLIFFIQGEHKNQGSDFCPRLQLLKSKQVYRGVMAQ